MNLTFRSIVMTLTAIFAGTLIGKLGDEKSRKLALFIPFIGLLLADVILILLSFFLESSSYFYIISEAVFGLSGGYVTILSSSFAYGSHLAKVSGLERSKAMSVLEGAIGCGSGFYDTLCLYNLYANLGVIGFLSTSLIHRIGYFNAYLSMTFIHILCGVLILTMEDIKPRTEESESKKKKFLLRLSEKLFSWRKLFSNPENRKKLLILISGFSFSFFAFIGTINIIFYYLKHRFHWDLQLYSYLKAPQQLTSTLAVSFFCMQSNSLEFQIIFLFPFLKTKVKLSDPTLALLGLLSRFLGRIWLAISWNTASVYFCEFSI